MEEGRDAVETFNPPFESDVRKGTIGTASFALISTIIGGGVLSLPFAFYSSGLVPGILLLLFIAVASDFTIYTLMSCSRRSGATSYEEVLQVAFGQGARKFTMGLILFTTFLTLIAYTILIRDLLSPLVEAYIVNGTLSFSQQNVVSSIAIAMVLPFCFKQYLSELQFVSVVCVMSVLVLAAGLAVRAVTATGDSVEGLSLSSHSISSVLDALPIFVSAYTCHFNVIPVHGELMQPTRLRIHQVTRLSVGIPTVIYLFVGITGFIYATKKDGVDGNVLLAFGADDALINAGRAALGITVMFSVPLLATPCRDQLLRILALYYSSKEQIDSAAEHLLPEAQRRVKLAEALQEDGGDDTQQEDDDDRNSGSARDSSTEAAHDKVPMDQPLLDGTQGEAERVRTLSLALAATEVTTASAFATPRARVIAALCVVGLAVFIGSLVKDVAIVWSVGGSSLAVLIGYILPCSSYVSIRTAKPATYRRKVWCWVFGVSTTIMAVACTINVLIELSSA